MKHDRPVLRPCPFCGGNAHVTEIESWHAVSDYSVSCDDDRNCIAGVPMRYYKTRADAIRAWNVRA